MPFCHAGGEVCIFGFYNNKQKRKRKKKPVETNKSPGTGEGGDWWSCPMGVKVEGIPIV